MYKIIIVTNAENTESTSDLLTSCIVMNDYRVIAIYAASEVEVSYDAEDMMESHLYPDCYDEDELDVEINNNCKGLPEIIDGLVAFLNIWFDEEQAVVYGYNIDTELMDAINDELESSNSDMVMQDYHSQFRDGRAIERNITDIMQDYHINSKLILSGSQISLLYFLGALTEKIHNN